jgi:tripartite-type tricarboxylate transporter receptor subunit TctC
VLSDGHLLLLELQRLSGADFAIVHGGGGAEGNADLLGGHVTAQTINLSGTNLALAQSGQIKVIALFTAEESPLYPGVTTATAQGFPILSSTSRGLSAPAGTPAPVVERLSQAVGRAMENPQFKERAAAMGLPLAYMDQDRMAEYWAAMETTFAPLVAHYVEMQ